MLNKLADWYRIGNSGYWRGLELNARRSKRRAAQGQTQGVQHVLSILTSR